MRETDAAFHDTRRELGEIADDAAAERHDQRAAFDVGAEETDDPFEIAEALGLFLPGGSTTGTGKRPASVRLAANG